MSCSNQFYMQPASVMIPTSSLHAVLNPSWSLMSWMSWFLCLVTGWCVCFQSCNICLDSLNQTILELFVIMCFMCRLCLCVDTTLRSTLRLRIDPSIARQPSITSSLHQRQTVCYRSRNVSPTWFCCESSRVYWSTSLLSQQTVSSTVENAGYDKKYLFNEAFDLRHLFRVTFKSTEQCDKVILRLFSFLFLIL